MTSNIGVKKLQDFGTGIGFSTNNYSNEEHKKEILKAELKKFFSPEFINRIDEVVVFNSLVKEDIKKIVSIELNKLTSRLNELKYFFKFDNKVIEHIAEVGYDELYGARPLKRAIQEKIEDKISEEILMGNVVEEKKYQMTYKNEEFEIKGS